METNLQRIDRIVEKLFCDSRTRTHGPLRRLRSRPLTEVFRGVLFEMGAESEKNERVTLRIYSGLGGLGGDLWEQEARSLVRLSAREHLALPRILDGGYNDGSDIGFVITESCRTNLTDGKAGALMKADPVFALQQLGFLADALRLMHEHGMLHGNLWHRTLELVEDEGGARRLCLAGFEMSMLLGNLLRHLAPEKRGDADRIRELLRGQGQQAFSCMSPEKLGRVLPGSPRNDLEAESSDVYSLGVLAAEWFVKDFPRVELERVFPEGDALPDWKAITRIHGELLHRIRESGVPRPLRQILERMLAPEPRQRLTSTEVVNELSAGYDAILAEWSDEVLARPYLLAYQLSTTGDHLKKWNFVGNCETLEVNPFITADLRGGSLVYSESGFLGFDTPKNPEDASKFREARWVLFGKEVAYFSSPYRTQDGRSTVPQALMIRYPIERHRAERLLGKAPLRRTVPPVETLERKSPSLDPVEIPEDAPVWTPLLASVETSKAPDEWRQDVRAALEFLLDVQTLQYKSRMYAYKTTAPEGNVYQLKWDRERDTRRIHEDPLFYLYASNQKRRSGFGGFFGGLDEAEEGNRLCFWPDNEGSPYQQRERLGFAGLKHALDEETLEVEAIPGQGVAEMPATGWLQPAGDRGTLEQLKRQRQGLDELLERPDLVDQLRRPTTVVRLKKRFASAGKELRGNAGDMVRDVLTCWPLYGLHGPPGTGKTTVAAEAILAALQADPSLRILVSSQSHYALDNLGERILKKLGSQSKRGGSGPYQAIRFKPREADLKVSRLMRKYFPDAQAVALRQHIQAQNRSFEQRGYPAGSDDIFQRWKTLVDGAELELKDRICRGANLVFTTCATAIPRNVHFGAGFETYDWVLIEEAAKAWPTELAIPLVRGARWTLIGDHKQLQAFGRQEIESFLDECSTQGSELLRRHGRAKERHLRVYDIFGGMFEAGKSGKAEGSGGLVRSATGALELQFRMHESIAQVVSKVFYQGQVKTDPEAGGAHGLKQPPELVGRPLVWLSTDGSKDRFEPPAHGSRRNVLEAQVVLRLVAQMRPVPAPPESNSAALSLAILSPYRDQLQFLDRSIHGETERFKHWPAARLLECLYTIDSFQGKEADIVIVSLVRCNADETVRGRLGFLTDYHRMNVLLSRAKRLMVLVGSFQHFSKSGDPVWERICESVRAGGTIVEVGDDGQPKAGQP